LGGKTAQKQATGNAIVAFGDVTPHQGCSEASFPREITVIF